VWVNVGARIIEIAASIIPQQANGKRLRFIFTPAFTLASNDLAGESAVMTVPDAMLEKLRLAAQSASEKAYAPYSEFHVGAAVLAESGEIFAGCNVENASYGLTICAERNAVFQAVAAGQRRLVACAIFVKGDRVAMPCGACRQVLREFGAKMEVLCFSDAAEPVRRSLGELLPESFGPESLG